MNNLGFRAWYMQRSVMRQARHLRFLGLAAWRKRSPNSYVAVRNLLFGERPAGSNDLPSFGSTIQIDGITMRIDPSISEANIRRLVTGRHTADERALAQKYLESDDIVLELGGGIGMVAIACARIVGSDRVFSFEANPRLEPLIRDNYALNDVSPTLTIAMVGADHGSRTFHLAEKFSESSVFGNGSGEIIQVPVMPFDRVVAEVKPTMLIADIEGAEIELLEYADLSGFRKILIEVHPSITGVSACLSLKDKLSDRGFRVQEQIDLNFMFVRGT